MNKDNNNLTKSQVNHINSNAPSNPPEDDFLESYTSNSFWDEHKTNTDYLSNLYSYNKKFERYAERTKTCSEFLVYANRLDLKNGELVKKLTNANFCRVRLCPVCQWRRSLMWQARFYDAIPKIMENYEGYRFLFLTLTVKNCPINQLSDTLIGMNKAFRKMLKYKRLEGVMQGWLKTTEVTRNSQTNEAHPHFHVLIMVKPSYFKKNYIRQFEFIEMWQKALKCDYLPNVDIRTVKNKHNNKEDLETAVQELLKYSVKEADLLADPDFLYTLTEEIFKKRFISSGGILKNILKEEDEEDLILSKEELDVIDDVENEEDSIVFKFNRNFNKYTKKRVTNGIVYQDQVYRQYKHNKLEFKKFLKDKKIEQENIKQEEIKNTEVPTIEVEGGELKWN